MKPLLSVLLLCSTGGAGLAAQCTTMLDPRLPADYQSYLRRAESASDARFAASEIGWMPPQALRDARAKLAAGEIVRANLSDAAWNQRLADRNGAIVHWIGAIRIRNQGLADLEAILQDYERWQQFYRPIVYASRRETGDALTLGLHSIFRFASVLPQHYSFRVQARMKRSAAEPGEDAPLRFHLAATEIRESDSGVPGRDDLLEAGRDHGIMWALNAYWRARREGKDIYLEFETITLARSVRTFACKIGILPVPRSAVSSAMDSIPAESVKVILKGTKAECERRAKSAAAATISDAPAAGISAPPAAPQRWSSSLRSSR